MLRLIGALLLTGATTAIGLGVAQRLGARVRILGQLCSAIQMMRGEIFTRMTPIPELFETLGAELEGPAALLFQNALKELDGLGNRSFLSIWRRAIDKTPELMLKEDEQSALRDLGYVLGRYGSTEQAAILDFAKRRFDAFFEAAKTEREKRGRVSVAFGVTAGLLAVILFL